VNFFKTFEGPFLDLPQIYSKDWASIDPKPIIGPNQAIEEALNFSKKIGGTKYGMQVLIT
jgi:hypothetical protein